MVPPRLYHSVLRIGQRHSFQWIKTSTQWLHSDFSQQGPQPNQNGPLKLGETPSHESKQKPSQCDDDSSSAQNALQTFISGRILSTQDRIDALNLFANRTLQRFGAKLNEVTGYEHIDALKKRVIEYGTLTDIVPL